MHKNISHIFAQVNPVEVIGLRARNESRAGQKRLRFLMKGASLKIADLVQIGGRRWVNQALE
jgi:hypothetical protein